MALIPMFWGRAGMVAVVNRGRIQVVCISYVGYVGEKE